MAGRNVKVGLDWFRLDVAMDTKLELLEAEYGLKGFAVFVKLLQRIYGENGYYCEWNDEVALLFSRRLGEGGNVVSEIVQSAIKRGIFDKRLYEEYGILTSHGIQKWFFEAAKRRMKIDVKNEYLLVHGVQNLDYVNINPINVYKNGENVDRNKHSIGQDSIGQDSIVNPLSVADKSASEQLNEKSKVDFQGVVDYWNKACPHLPQVRSLTETRKTHIRKRVEEHGKRTLKEIVDAVAESDFLSGRTKEQFKASFDWIIAPRNFVKIMDGNYANKQKTINDVTSNRAMQAYLNAEFDEEGNLIE